MAKGELGSMGFSGRRSGLLAVLGRFLGVVLAVGPWRPLFLLHGPVA